MNLFKLTLYIGLLLLVGQINSSYAVGISGGGGGIDFDGKGTIQHMDGTAVVQEVYSSDCIPVEQGKFIIRCHPQIDTSLLRNDIVRAEYIRIVSSVEFVVTFGCSGCASQVEVRRADLLPSSSRLNDEKTAAIQTLIDQYGAANVRMAMSIFDSFFNTPSLNVSSVVKAVELDNKPGADTNKLNIRSRGVIRVAVLSTPSFDASSIDVDTLRFGATGHNGASRHSVLDDVDADGDADLLIFFEVEETEIDCDTLFTYLTGSTLTGQLIAGTDAISIVGCH